MEDISGWAAKVNIRPSIRLKALLDRSDSDAGGDQGRDGRKPLPLHRLFQNVQRGGVSWVSVTCAVTGAPLFGAFRCTAWLGSRLLPDDYVSLRFADHIKQILLLGRRDLEFVQGFLELLGHHAPLFLADVQMSM